MSSGKAGRLPKYSIVTYTYLNGKESVKFVENFSSFEKSQGYMLDAAREWRTSSKGRTSVREGNGSHALGYECKHRGEVVLRLKFIDHTKEVTK